MRGLFAMLFGGGRRDDTPDMLAYHSDGPDLTPLGASRTPLCEQQAVSMLSDAQGLLERATRTARQAREKVHANPTLAEMMLADVADLQDEAALLAGQLSGMLAGR